MAKITDYPSITTIDANTILLADGSSGTGKILASDMAKYALETYAGSTLAGSAQSVKSAFNALNSKNIATNTEIDALNSKTSGITKTITKGIGDGTNADISIDSNVRGLIVVSCSRATGKGMYIFNSTSAGVASVEAVMAASGVTLTPGTNNINIGNMSGVTVIMFMLVYKL